MNTAITLLIAVFTFGCGIIGTVFFYGSKYGGLEQWRENTDKRLDSMEATAAAVKAEVDEVAIRFGNMLSTVKAETTSLMKAVEKLDKAIDDSSKYFRERIDKIADRK